MHRKADDSECQQFLVLRLGLHHVSDGEEKRRGPFLLDQLSQNNYLFHFLLLNPLVIL
jgi:hypothetical protein